MRFPGQYEDAETGWHYNFHRFHDPSTGRFVDPDPLGITAGINLYAYARSIPTVFTDPLGLASLTTVMDPDRGTTTFDPRPEDPNGSPYTIVTNNEIASSAASGAGDPFATPDSNPLPVATNPRAYGPCCDTYIDTGDPRGRDIHGGGSVLR